MKRIALIMRRTGLVAVLATVLLGAMPGIASARSVSETRWRSTSAEVWWLEIDPVDANGIVGWHQGWLSAYQNAGPRASVYLFISDAFCPEGVTPWFGHGGEEVANPAFHHEPPDDGCEYSSRWGEGSRLSFTMDRTMNTARLTGRVTIYGGHGGSPVGTPPVDIIWTGFGEIFKFSSHTEYRYPWGIEIYDETRSERSATMGGNIGPMGFHPDRSGGSMARSAGTSKIIYF